MSYSPPSVGPSGLTVPSYNDILAFYVSSFQSLYGSTVYLGNDSADFQLLSILALAASDTNAALQLAWNNMSPSLAIGAGLSALVANNGLQRKIASFSTCLVTLTGTPGALVTNGIIQNSATGDLWNLPTPLTIGLGGTVNATATAQAAGAINALASQLTIIVTPTSGWVSVTNGSNVASLGQPIETDSQLRQRQAVSTLLPSITLLSGTIAAIAATPGVTRYNVLENFTNATDGFGNPAHSVSAVVEGGTNLAVATAIYNNRGIGPLTNGSTGGTLVAQPVTDPNSGITITINFARPANIPIFIIVNAHPIAGGTLSAAQILGIQNALLAYLAGLQIGEVVSFGELIQAAASVNVNPLQPTISIRSPFFFGTSASPSTSTDVPMNFYQVAQGILANIIVNSV